MATFQILKETPPYLTVRIEFQGLTFDQQITTDKLNEDRTAQLQDYADRYEVEWLDLQTTNEVV